MSFRQKMDQKENKDSQQVEMIFQILTGQIRYKTRHYTETDLSPDLIIKISVPNSQYIPRSSYLQLSNYVAFPSHKLEKAFQKAQKLIIKQMNDKKQNNDPSSLKIRLQKAIVPSPLKIKTNYFIDEYNEEQLIQLESIYMHNGILDSFTIQYNAVLYILQNICGFRVRAFLLYDESQSQKDIYLFLSLSTQNYINLAKRYRIKKQIDYTFIDFFMNDPSTSDYRPLKYASSIKPDIYLQSHIKSINRYFKVNNSIHNNTDIIQQRQLQQQQISNFRDYMDDLDELYLYFREKRLKQISNKQKSYIYEFNRRKINKGCQKLYSIIQQRRQFFQINKQILNKYHYKVIQQPTVYQEFSLPDKHSKSMSFFDKFYNLLLYLPQVVSPEGDLDLFLNMEKTKLCYLIIKNNFKINYLQKIGFQFLSLSNSFQKFGKNNRQIKGGINGKNLESQWPIYALFSDINVIRNYVGDKIAYQVLIKKVFITFFLLTATPFTLLFICQQVFGSIVDVYTTLIQTLFYVATFQIFIIYWKGQENQFMENYLDSVSSKVFLSEFKGPFRRNVLTDQVNQFQSEEGFYSAFVNAICIIVILALLVCMGFIFHGCRMLLVAIFSPLSYLVVSKISIPHIISYLLFFFSADLAAILATDKIISIMVKFQNPPNDEDETQRRQNLSFFYLLGKQLIPPFFFLILQPFQRTSCYSNQCLDQIQYYVYSRMMITFIASSFRLTHVFLFKYLNTKEFFKKEEPTIYQGKLAQLLTKAVKQSKKIEYISNNNEVIVVLVSFSIYCIVLPLVSLLAFIAIVIKFINTRLTILYQARRPINKSEKLILFGQTAQTIFFIGIIFQAWISVFTFNFIEDNLQQFIKSVSSKITQQGIFLFKLACTAAYSLILLAMSKGISAATSGWTSNALSQRKKNKYKQFLHSRGRMKQEIKKQQKLTPLKTLFRANNPQKLPHEYLEYQLKQLFNEQDSLENENQIHHMDSLINITQTKLK